MKFVCDRCQTKYSIADDKVRGKVLKVRCKTCQNVITVREAGAKPSVGGLAPVRPSAPVSTLGESHEDPSERTAIAASPLGLMADLAPGRRPTPPPPPPLGDGIEWFLALEGAQQGPFTRKLLVDKVLALPKEADVHVWNDQMDGWKAPVDVPDVARDLAARRAPGLPTRPPLPRHTPSPPAPPVAARRPAMTQPLVSGVGAKIAVPTALPTHLPAPTTAAAHAHAVPAPHAHEPSAKAPPPFASHAPAHAPAAHAPAHAPKTNGVAAHASAPATALPGGESDALSALNLGGTLAPAGAKASSAAAPRIMDVGEATAWSGAGRVQEDRHKNTKMAFGLLGLVAVIIVVVALNMRTKPPVVATQPPAKAGLDSEALGKLNEMAAQQKNEPPKPTAGEEPSANSEPTRGGRNARGKAVRGRAQPARGATSPSTFTGTSATAAPTAATTPAGGAFHERSVTPVAASTRPPPNQGEISRVIANNKLGIKTCYQRALLRDSNLTHGKIVVGVSIGISGRVKHVTVDGPSSFRTLEPCIKEMVGRWTFPQSGEEYGTEFSYLFQGNE
ncbi:MAG TPA: AgmX/PglI C-terminal domain-containing protein [Polyangia bacterium]|jgi:predicted Zn finger-like uncharacterized protein|nr:AgmX/PglI C-terminal domain-containing protein [Polyangia bacterium]